MLRLAIDNQRHILGRVAAHVVYTPLARLSDGSFLATVYPSQKDRRRGTRGVIVRVIEYTFDDEGRPGHGERHRRVTTLLDDHMYPARELIALYHERWEIEIDDDEIATHQLNRPVACRSKKPVGVVQEFYGLLPAHNAIRFLMHESAVQMDLDPRRRSFIHAVRVIRETIPPCAPLRPRSFRCSPKRCFTTSPWANCPNAITAAIHVSSKPR